MSKEPTTRDIVLNTEPLKVVDFLEELSRTSDALILQPWSERVLENIEDHTLSQLHGPTFERIMVRTFEKYRHLFTRPSETHDAVCMVLTEVSKLCKHDKSLSWLATIFLREYQLIASSFPDGLSYEDSASAERTFAAAFLNSFGLEEMPSQVAPSAPEQNQGEDEPEVPILRDIDRFRIYLDGTIEFGEFRHNLDKQEFKLLKILIDPVDQYHSFDKLIEKLFKSDSTRPREYKVSVIKRLLSRLIGKLATIGLDIKLIENNNLNGVIFHSRYILKPLPARYEMSGTIKGKKKSSG